MEIDKAFRFAVVLAWDDLVKVSKPYAARVEYGFKPGTTLDYLSVWSFRAGGEQELVCDYWTRVSSAHVSGMRFRNGHCSDPLARVIDLIMKNQDQFTQRAEASSYGRVLIYPPAADERAEATAWVKEVQGNPIKLGGAADETVPVLTPSTTSQIRENEPAVS